MEKNIKWIEECVKTYFEPYTGKGGTTWSFEFKSWGNKTVDRASYLDLVYKLINTENSGNSVDLRNGAHSIFLEVVHD